MPSVQSVPPRRTTKLPFSLACQVMLAPALVVTKKGEVVSDPVVPVIESIVTVGAVESAAVTNTTSVFWAAFWWLWQPGLSDALTKLPPFQWSNVNPLIPSAVRCKDCVEAVLVTSVPLPPVAAEICPDATTVPVPFAAL